MGFGWRDLVDYARPFHYYSNVHFLSFPEVQAAPHLQQMLGAMLARRNATARHLVTDGATLDNPNHIRLWGN